MNAEITLPLRPRLPVWSTVTRSYVYVWENWKQFALPVALIFLVTVVLNAGEWAEARNETATNAIVYLVLLLNRGNILGLFFWIPKLVGIHRRILGVGITFGMIRYLWAGFLILMCNWVLYSSVILICLSSLKELAALFSGSNHIAQPIADILTFLTLVIPLIVCVPLFARLCLAFPTAALGDRKGLSLSWRATRGNTWRMSAALIVTGLPLALIGLAAIAPFLIDGMSAIARGQASTEHLGSISIGIFAIVTTLAPPIFTVMLSFSYDVLVRGGKSTM